MIRGAASAGSAALVLEATVSSGKEAAEASRVEADINIRVVTGRVWKPWSRGLVIHLWQCRAETVVAGKCQRLRLLWLDNGHLVLVE